MANPWEEIPLSDYENHMQFDSVMQLQCLNRMMRNQFNAYPISSAVILGIAGGNGLEHMDRNKYHKVVGVDINGEYLAAVRERYGELADILECVQLDLLEEADRLPKAELLVADLLIEYIGYACFQKAVQQVAPNYVSCIIQINASESWVSDSPYLHAFDQLAGIHHQMEENELTQTLGSIGYRRIARAENQLPSGTKLLQIDFAR